MPQYYNGITRPVTDGIDGTGAGSVSALSHYNTIVDDIYGGDPTRMVFGFCISDCSGTGSIANGQQALTVMNDLNAEHPCNGGAFFWVAEHDQGASWSSLVSTGINSDGCSTIPSQAPNKTPSPSISTICPIDEIYGQTFLFALLNACWKVEVFNNGKVQGDLRKNVPCTNDSFVSFGTFSLYGDIDNDSDLANFIVGPGGYHGTFLFRHSESVTSPQGNILKFNSSEKEYAVEVEVPSCIKPTDVPSLAPTSLSCSIEDIYDQTFYFSAAKICWKVEIFDGGLLEGDLSNPSSCSENTFNPGKTFSFFNQTDTFSNQASFANGLYNGAFQFKTTLESIPLPKADILLWNSAEKEFVVELTIPRCTTLTASPSSVPSSPPTSASKVDPCCPMNYTGLRAWNQCYQYYHCVNGVVTGGLLDVPSGTLFDQSLQNFNWAHLVVCVVDDCRGKRRLRGSSSE